ncbi:MAG: hypothetical protein ACFFCZ_03815 [Promethearchaeota archaeon]
MTEHNNRMKLKSALGEEEEENFEIEKADVRPESLGRPVWWFNGSLFKPKTVQERKLFMLQYQTLARTDPVLSSRAQRIRQYISVLSQWFPVPLLDEVGKELLFETAMRQNDKNLLAHLLGSLEVILRQYNSTIRWTILQEINQTTGHQLEKKDIYKWMFYTRQRKNQQVPDTLRVVQHLTIEMILHESIPSEQKRQFCLKVTQVIKFLRSKGFVCKDPEITAWALKRIILRERGAQKSIPKEFRAATTRMTFRLRKILKNN